VSHWQTIETAPKDGTWLLVQSADWTLPEVAQWCRSRRYWQTMESNVKPTHWMPLPEPPK
jgi:predicted alpha/beta hydrolase family esterase